MAHACPIRDDMKLPSPVRRLVRNDVGNELWLKDDSRIHPVYGGNKARKLAQLLGNCLQRGAGNVATFGTAGSHHVLATSLLSRCCGMSARAFVIAQPWSAHAEEVLRSSVMSGVELLPVDSLQQAATAFARLFDARTAFIPPGGTNVCGSLGYYDAALELASQVDRGELPEPDWIVVPFGTGGTAAGLLAGVTAAGLKSRLLGVSVVGGPNRAWVAHRIADGILKTKGSRRRVRRVQLHITKQWLAGGYGLENRDGVQATTRAAQFDLPLDPSYTAKAFAGAWALLEGRNPGNCNSLPLTMPSISSKILYWHTLSTPWRPSGAADDTVPLPNEIRGLLRRSPKC